MHAVKIAWVALAVFAACGGSSLSKTAPEYVQARSAVRGAEEIFAEQEPKAKYHLDLARTQIAEAEALMKDGEGNEARRVLERARADAEAAVSLARAEWMRREAQQELDMLDKLLEEQRG